MSTDQDFPEQIAAEREAELSRSGPPTSQDVARLAKVSRATVSYVLNDVPNSRISEATQERVKKAAAELGYVPHEMASSLRTGHSDLVLLPFFDWPYNQRSIAFLQELALELNQRGYTVMLQFFGRDNTSATVRKIASFHPIGVIVLSGELSSEDIEILSRNGVQAILGYGEMPTASIPAINVDFSSVGECAAQHFISRGHQHIAAIVPCDPRISMMGEQRLAGLKRVGERSGLRIERIDLEFNPHEAAALVNTWQQGSHPTGVFTYNDEYAFLLMSALQDAGLKIPDDVALVGCDDLPFSELMRPRLTSIDIGNEQIVLAVATYFDNLIQEQECEAPPHAPVSPKIVIRESS